MVFLGQAAIQLVARLYGVRGLARGRNRAGYWFFSNRPVNPGQIESIVVLPLINASGNPDESFYRTASAKV